MDIRFHGRGGHGVKTAGRILGTAAFLAGYQCQDSPVYGAERRGAAVVSFARISRAPIATRGPIVRPDLILVADETLLADPAARVLEGQQAASALFLNTSQPEGARERHGIVPEVIALDLSGRTRQWLGRASALSAGLAAAAVRLAGGISADCLREALEREFSALHLPDDLVEKNARLAAGVFAELTAVPLRCVATESGDRVIEVPDLPARASAPSILATGNAALRGTGAWRVERPVIDRDICTRCGLCFAVCPDGAITLDDDEFPMIDYDHCKGCMLCRERCPLHAIGRRRETQAW